MKSGSSPSNWYQSPRLDLGKEKSARMMKNSNQEKNNSNQGKKIDAIRSGKEEFARKILIYSFRRQWLEEIKKI